MTIENETIPIRTGEEFDTHKVEQYLRQHIEGLGEGSLYVRQFPSGASNLTYLLQIGNWEEVLRRPPFGPIPPKAHDMEREAGLLQKIAPVFPLAPMPYFFCNDPAILGVPFYIMERKKGVLINDRFPSDVTPTPALCRKISETMVDTLVQIHAIDWRAVGLADFGHPTDFLERQVTGWIGRYTRSQSDESPDATTLTRWLVEHIPVSPAPALIHNDFKLNNMLLDAHDLARPVAVLDWEMATIGDPLFDLATSLSYWVQSDDPAELREILPTITHLPGFYNRAEFMERYATKSARDLSSMHFYLTFAYFKLATILQQIYIRWLRGQTQDPRFAIFGSRINILIDHATQLASHTTL